MRSVLHKISCTGRVIHRFSDRVFNWCVCDGVPMSSDNTVCADFPPSLQEEIYGIMKKWSKFKGKEAPLFSDRMFTKEVLELFEGSAKSGGEE